MNNSKAPTRQEEQLAWHYTISDRAKYIVESKFIYAATAGVPAGERPCIWFSLEQFWEPTANKAESSPSGHMRKLNFEEMVSLGLWRFGLPVAMLLDWRQLKRETRMSRKVAKGLVSAARSQGSNPELWYGAMKPVPVDDCVVQRLIDGEWS